MSFGFGATNTGFGAAGGAFGTAAAGGGGAFGQPQPAAGGFGGASAFGAAKPAGFGTASTFGNSPSTMGQPSMFGSGANTSQAYGGTAAATGGFGQPAAGGAFGQPAAGGAFGQPAAGGAYGQPAAGGAFGQQAAGGAFGQPAAGGAFGARPATTGGAFGQPAAGGAFGQQAAGGAFGQQAAGGAFGQPAAGGAFGQQAAGGAFGQPAAGGAFGQQAAGGAFGQPAAGGAFGQQAAGGAFGQPAAGGAFGQPAAGGAFGQPAAGGAFGQQAAGGAFGQQAAGGAFGARPATTGGAFGQPAAGGAFGQPAAGGAFGQQAAGGFGQPAAGGAFGQPAAGGVFGQQAAGGAFGQQAAGGAFGQQAAGGAFGQQAAGGAFGQQSAGGAFGQQAAGGAFGQQAAGGAFGQPAAGGAFGQQAAGGAFGQPAVGAPTTGTGVPAFVPLQVKDSIMPPGKNRKEDVMLKVMAITAMPAYKTKSFEQLRYEDYCRNNRTPGQQPQPTTGGFGQSAAGGAFGQPAAGGAFGQPAAGGAFGQQAAGGAFGQPAAGGAFGQQAAGGAFGQQAAGGFGQQATGAFGQQAAGGAFGQPASGGAFGQQGTAGAFGQQSTGGAFGQPAAGGAFGQPAAGGAFGQPAAGGAFGQQAAGGAFGQPAGGAFGQPAAGGAFGQQAAGGAFGQPAAGGAFGQQAAGGAFGQPAAGGAFGQQAAGGAFGQQAAGGAFGQQAAGGAFGQQAAGGAFGQPAAGGFGQPAAGGAFGQTAGAFGATKPATTGFGATTTTPATGGFGGFGAATTTPATGGFGGFGAGTTTPATGGFSAFGATKPATTGFGAATTTPATGGFGGFGAGTTTPATGGFSAFGATKPATTGFGAATTTPATGGFGGFGATTTGFGATTTGSGAAPTAPVAAAPVVPPTPTVSQVIDAIVAHVDANLKPSSGTSSGLTDNTTTASPLPTASTLSSLSLAGVTARAYSLSRSRGDRPIRVLPRQLQSNVTPLPLSDGLVAAHEKLVFSVPCLPNGVRLSGMGTDAHRLDVRLDIVADLVLEPPASPHHESLELLPIQHDEVSDLISNDQEVEAPSSVLTETTANLLPTLTREDYYCSPTLEELARLTPEELASVSNFLIGRKEIGEIRWQEPVDLRKLNLDEIVSLAPREASVYGSTSESSPPLGTGLNVPAVIVFQKVLPPGKLSAESFASRLRLFCDRNEATFINYDPENAEWSFRVEHFSRYALDDEDEEEVDQQNDKSTETKEAMETDHDENNSPVKRPSDELFPTVELLYKRVRSVEAIVPPTISAPLAESKSLPPMPDVSNNMANLSILNSPTARILAAVKRDAAVRLGSTVDVSMAETFTKPFRCDDAKAPATRMYDLRLAMGRSFRVCFTPDGRLFRPIAPGKSTTQSILEDNQAMDADGRPVDSLWEECLQHIRSTSKPNKDGSEKEVCGWSLPSISKDDGYGEFLLLLNNLETSLATAPADTDHPFARLATAVRLLVAARGQECEVKTLEELEAMPDCDLLMPITAPTSDSPSAMDAWRRRCIALSRWIADAAQADGDLDGEAEEAAGAADVFRRVFQLLAIHRTEDAVAALSAAGHHRAAVLTAQAGANPASSALLRTQLAEWRACDTMSGLSPAHHRLYALLAGEVVDNDGKPILRSHSATGTMHWIRALGVLHWYFPISDNSSGSEVASPISAEIAAERLAGVPSFRSALDRLDFEVSESHADPPHRVNSNTDPAPMDALYALARLLYPPAQVTTEDKKRWLAAALSPEGYSSAVRDYRAPFVILCLLEAMEITSPDSIAAITVRLGVIEQLLAHSQWKWAAFVATHLPSSIRPTFLERLLTCSGPNALSILPGIANEFGIPQRFVASCAADLATVRGDISERLNSLLSAGRDVEAIGVFTAQVVPLAILSSRVEDPLPTLVSWYDARSWVNVPKVDSLMKIAAFFYDYLGLRLAIADATNVVPGESGKDVISTLTDLVSTSEILINQHKSLLNSEYLLLAALNESSAHLQDCHARLVVTPAPTTA